MAYTEEIATALAMITESGTPVTIRRWAHGTYNPVTDVDTGAAWQTFVTSAAKLPLLTGQTLRDQAMAPGAALQGDKAIALMPAVLANGSPFPFTPMAGDKLVFGASSTPDATWWTISSVSVLEPDNVPITYTAIITQGVDGSGAT